MIGPSPICLECSRLQGRRKNRSPSCAAFPKGIPDAIYLGAFDHRSAYVGDKGIRFQLAEGKAVLLAGWVTLHGRGTNVRQRSGKSILDPATRNTDGQKKEGK
jgi:hypothetical protein